MIRCSYYRVQSSNTGTTYDNFAVKPQSSSARALSRKHLWCIANCAWERGASRSPAFFYGTEPSGELHALGVTK